MLPFDLHVLGLPPAFNLSHDQTLQFKFDARELNFVMNYVCSLRDLVFIFRLATLRIRIFECPHRLSDKLLKSSAASFFAAARGVHITLSRCRVKHLFLLSLPEFSGEPR